MESCLPNVVVTRYIVHWDILVHGEYTAESAVVSSYLFVQRVRRGNIRARTCALSIRHGEASAIHHVPKEYDYIWSQSEGSPPALPQVQVDHALAESHQQWVPAWIRPVVKHLRVGYEQYTRCLMSSIQRLGY